MLRLAARSAFFSNSRSFSTAIQPTTSFNIGNQSELLFQNPEFLHQQLPQSKLPPLPDLSLPNQSDVVVENLIEEINDYVKDPFPSS